MARKITAAEKTALAAARAAGFQVGAEVAIKSGSTHKVGVVTASNGYITNVTWYNEALGREVVGSWATRSVKFADMV